MANKSTLSGFRFDPADPNSSDYTPELQCEYCGGSGDVSSITGEWLGVCACECGDAIRAKMEQNHERS